MYNFNIVRIEFPPVVEIDVNRGHYFPQETNNEGPTLKNAWACYNLYIIINNLSRQNTGSVRIR